MHPVRLLAAACIALVLPLAASAEPAQVRRDGAQVRGAIGFTGAVIASPARGEQVEVLEASNEWRRVRTSDGREGWVHELFLDERQGTARPSISVPAPSRKPGALPRAEPFEAPDLDEQVQAAPAAELQRLRAELARERAARGEAERARAAADRREGELTSELAALRREVQRLESAAAGDARALRRVQAQLQEANDRALTGLSNAEAEAEAGRALELSRLAREHEQAMAALEAAHQEELAEIDAQREEELAEARSANAAEIAELQRRLQEDQDRIGQDFVEKCTALHERELGRKKAEWAASCEERVRALQAAQAKELRKVSKESGWEAEFEGEVREKVREGVAERIDEARLRWEAKNRGDKVELDKELAKLRAKLEAECEGRVLAAVNAELDRHRVEMRKSLRALQFEEERRCKAALELVLQRSGASPPSSGPLPRGEGP